MRKPAFTLIELLVVIAIISLLAAILVPVVSAAIRQMEDQRSRAWVLTLKAGCDAFYMDTGYYPGQNDPTAFSTSGGPLNGWTGSQYLAKALFRATTTSNYPVGGKYGGGVRADDLIYRSGNDPTQPAYYGYISDRTSKPLPVLYFPARLGQSPDNPTNLYKYADNQACVELPLAFQNYQKTNTTADFSTYQGAMSTTFSSTNGVCVDVRTNKALNPDGYLLFAAGLDRVYFTADDIRN